MLAAPTKTLPVPPAFDATMWEGHPDGNAGPYYKGTQFAFEELNQLIQVDNIGLGWLVVCGKFLPVLNLQLEADSGENYPIYFELTGRSYHYVVNVWCDRVSIHVCDTDPDSYRVRSVLFPTTIEQLERALNTMVSDYCRFMELPHEVLATC